MAMPTDSRQPNAAQQSLFHFSCVCVCTWYLTRPCVYTPKFAAALNRKCARRDGTDSPRRSMEDGPPVAAGEASVGRRRKLNPDGTYRCHSDKQ